MAGELTIEQFQLGATSIGAAGGAMVIAALFFLTARSTVDERYRPGVVLAAAICGVAGFHYVLAIFEWRAAYLFDGTVYRPSEHPFINSARYADWFITLPMLAIQILFIAELPRRKAIRIGVQLVVASLAMLALGYPGEVSNDRDTKLFFLVVAALPLLYVVFLLWVQLTRSLDRQHYRAGPWVSNARMVLLGSWLLYPVAYLFPVFGFDTGWGEALRQTFYGVADLISKPVFGLMILQGARAASRKLASTEPSRDDRLLRSPPPLAATERSRRLPPTGPGTGDGGWGG